MNKGIGFLLVAVATIIVSCDDIFEHNISDDVVTLRTPGDSYTTTAKSITLLWDAVDGASGYQLTVATPDYEHADRIVADTTVTRTQFSVSMEEGKYQWCVRAINSGYETDYSCRALTVVHVIEEDISSSSVLLRGPSDNYHTKAIDATFWWDTVAGAKQYEFLVVSPDYQNPETLEMDTVIAINKLVTKLPAGSYQWCVRAINSDYETAYSCRTIVVNQDISSSTVNLKAPTEGFTTSAGAVTLLWNELPGAEQYDLQIVSPTITNPNTIPVNVTISEKQYAVQLPVGKYQWCVRGVNANYKTDYTCRTLTIQ